MSELLPHRRMIFNLLYRLKLAWIRSGYGHNNALPLADLLVFCKVKASLRGRILLIISGGAPLRNDIEEFLIVTSCAFFVQGYGLMETCGLTSVGFPDEMSLIGTVGVASTYNEIRFEEVPDMGYDPLAVPSRGDIGEMSEDGVLKIIDGKNIFKISQGYYVAAKHLEKVYSFATIVEDG